MYKKIKSCYRIKDIAKEKGITITRLAEIIETTQPNLSAIINEKTNPSVDMLQRIAGALKVHISELFKQSDTSTIKCPKCGTELEVKAKNEI